MNWKRFLLQLALLSHVIGCELPSPSQFSPALRTVEYVPTASSTTFHRASEALRRRGILRRKKTSEPENAAGITPCPSGIVRYPQGLTHSPITCGVASRLRAVLENRALPHPKIFMKVGDSISASTDFMNCFETDEPNLPDSGYGNLQAAWQWYLEGHIGMTTSYARQSRATRVAQTASWVLGGEPSPLSTEIAAIDPSVALVMFGTNDMYYGGHAAPASLKFPWMFSQMKRLLKVLLARGIVPILYSIPPYEGAHWQLATLVESYNIILRGLAEGLQIPFVDYHARMQELPGMGLRNDGVHPNTSPNSACDFTEAGLQYGNNLRNLLTLEALNRVWQVTENEDGRDHWEEMNLAAEPQGETFAYALPVSSERYARFGDLRNGFTNELVGNACPGRAMWTGPRGNQQVFRISFPEDTPARVMLLHDSSKKIHLSWWSAQEDNSCVKSHPVLFQGVFPAGDHFFVVEAESPADEGEFLFLNARCAPSDSRCQQNP